MFTRRNFGASILGFFGASLSNKQVKAEIVREPLIILGHTQIGYWKDKPFYLNDRKCGAGSIDLSPFVNEDLRELVAGFDLSDVFIDIYSVCGLETEVKIYTKQAHSNLENDDFRCPYCYDRHMVAGFVTQLGTKGHTAPTYIQICDISAERKATGKCSADILHRRKPNASTSTHVIKLDGPRPSYSLF